MVSQDPLPKYYCNTAHEQSLKGLAVQHGLIDYIDAKAKCRHVTKFTCKGTLRQVFICLRTPSPRRFLWWSRNFVGSESGQIQSVKFLQNMASNRTQHPHPPSNHTLSLRTVL
jgi:hypothetical protein